MRELRTVDYDSRGYTDENLLYKYKAIEPDVLSMNLTYLYGKDNAMFPLLNLTEGNGLVTKKKAMKDSQFTWPVMGVMKETGVCIGLSNTSITTPGIGFTSFKVQFADNWIAGQYTAISPDGNHIVRMQGEPEMLSTNVWEYTMVLDTASATESVSLSNFINGISWVSLAPVVAFSKSDQTRSNSMAPGEMTNQFSLLRFGKEITGNVASKKVTNYQLDLDGGGKTNMWMPYEMKLFEVQRRKDQEELLWYSKYNRDANGVIHMKDDKTNEPIPMGSGIKESLDEIGNLSTYSTFTKNRLDTIYDQIYSNRLDGAPMEIVIYTGTAGIRQFDQAMKTDAEGHSYWEALGMNEVKSSGEYLTYGKYFRQYKHINGTIFTVKEAEIFDKGKIAKMQKKNGHLIDGLPRNSSTMVFLDHSLDVASGERNIQLVCEEGRENITGIYKGMTNLPGAWGAIPNNLVSDTKDVASYHVMVSSGINMLNPTTSFWLERE